MIESSHRDPVSPAEPRRAVPAFEPHPWIRGGHAQTIAGRYFWNGDMRLGCERHEVALPDGDRLCVLESTPRQWSSSAPVAVLVHGLAGCARSPYVVRLARRLLALGVRVVRINLRGAGDGFGLARGIYHAGRSDDLRHVVAWAARRAPGSPVGLVGFSLGANLVLKLAGEAADHPVPGLDCILAANPPIDLAACARAMSRPENWVYDRNFVRWLCREVARLHQAFPDLGEHALGRVSSVYEFDERYTAPRNGFASADDYYRRSSALALVPRIAHPGLVVHAEDDPFIPAEPFLRARFPLQLRFELVRHGGHLGYVSRQRWLGDRRWLDARLAFWLSVRWSSSSIDRDHAWSSFTRGWANSGASRSHA
jgi:predicted alpha/beta-fold hydrolase